MEKRKVKIPLYLLPKDYKAIGSKEFNKSESLISKVVNGDSRNDEIFSFFLSMAEKRKVELNNRLAALEN